MVSKLRIICKQTVFRAINTSDVRQSPCSHPMTVKPLLILRIHRRSNRFWSKVLLIVRVPPGSKLAQVHFAVAVACTSNPTDQFFQGQPPAQISSQWVAPARVRACVCARSMQRAYRPSAQTYHPAQLGTSLPPTLLLAAPPEEAMHD